MNKNYLLLLFISIFNILFPVLGLIIIVICFLLTTSTVCVKKIYLFNISYSIGMLASMYVRLDGSGDLSNYILSLEYYSKSLLTHRTSIITSLYELFYPVWYFMLYLISVFDLTIKSLSFVSIFVIYFCNLFVIFDLSKNEKQSRIDKLLLIKLLLLFSFVAVFSSFKTLLAFSLVYIGVFFLIKKKKIGYFLTLLGLGVHPIAILPLLIYFISIRFNHKRAYIYISIIISLLFKFGKSIVFSLFSNIPFIGSKVNTYFLGDWSNYRFNFLSEYVVVFIIVVFIILILGAIFGNLVDVKNSKSNFFDNYNNFILWFFTFSLLLVPFRTTGVRLFYDGAIFYFPFLYQILKNRKIYKKKIFPFLILLLWFLLIDFRMFNIYNNSYVIGLGFPLNLFESPLLNSLFK